ncbi:MAG: NAD-dependent epimerase/dehydratase family protein [Elusimicrobia bacterium]|nr:NAD-dependent epimerase/dehydratase family protein [Elusimicrobiota bacterium]
MTGSSILHCILDTHSSVSIHASFHATGPDIQDQRIKYIHGDLRVLEDCRRMAEGCDCAIMAAAYTGGAAFVRSQPWKHMDENLMINKQMLEAFHLEHIKRIIFLSSAAVYHEFEGSIKEDEINFNIDPHDAYFGYGWGMRYLEKMCELLHKKYDIDVIIVRAANIFGPRDKFNPQLSNFIPAIIRKAVDRMEPFELWGAPDVTRDVIYVDDFARAIVMMADNDAIRFEAFNVGTGMKTTVSNVVEWVLKYANHTPSQITYTQDRPTSIKFRALDCTKVKKDIGWEPNFTVEEGVKKTTEWWINHKDIWKK